MTLRTVEQLSDALSTEIIWRKKELTALRWMVESSLIAADRRVALLRSAVALLYAHWEGFVKTTSRFYLEFVQLQRLTYSELAPNFVAFGSKKLLHEAGSTSKHRVHLDVTDFFLNRMGERANLPFKDGISTRSNLSSQVLREVTETLGLDYSEFTTKEKLIDELLLRQRNTIAHGEFLLISDDAYLDLHEQVLAMMECFRNQIDNAASLQQFRATPTT